MATRILHGTQLFEGIWKRTTYGTFLWNLVKIQLIVSEEFFEGKVYRCTNGRTDGQMDAGHNAMTIARWPSASGAINCSSNFSFLQSFLPFERTFLLFSSTSKMSPANSFSFEESKTFLTGKSEKHLRTAHWMWCNWWTLLREGRRHFWKRRRGQHFLLIHIKVRG